MSILSISPMKADLATVTVPSWRPPEFPVCHGAPKKAAGKYYRLLRLKCLTTYLANRYPLPYLVLGYRSNTEIMFPSPFTSHSRPPKKHPPCHHTQLTRQPRHNSHCSGDLKKAARPLWQGESSHIKQIISSTHLDDLKSCDRDWIGCCTFPNHFVLSVFLKTKFPVFGIFLNWFWANTYLVEYPTRQTD